MSARLSLAAPMTAPLRELSPELLDMLQVVHNHGSLAEVLNHSEQDDVVAAEAVLQLIKRDYVRAG